MNIFDGEKFVVPEQDDIQHSWGFSLSLINPSSPRQQLEGYINLLDAYSLGDGYEFYSLTDTCVIFKKLN